MTVEFICNFSKISIRIPVARQIRTLGFSSPVPTPTGQWLHKNFCPSDPKIPLFWLINDDLESKLIYCQCVSKNQPEKSMSKFGSQLLYGNLEICNKHWQQMTKLWHRLIDLKNLFLRKDSNNTALNLPAITLGDHRISPLRRTSITKPISENSMRKILRICDIKMMVRSKIFTFLVRSSAIEFYFKSYVTIQR